VALRRSPASAALPLRLKGRTHPGGACALLQQDASPQQRRVVARVAQAELSEAELAPALGNGNGSTSAAASDGAHDNHYAPPARAAATLAVHAGEDNGRLRQGVADSLTTPIVQTSTYTFKDTAELIAYQEGRHGSFEYGRYGNPTARVVEEKISALEGAEDCLLSSSGMCSATTMLLALVPAGGHIVTTTDCYRRTRQFIQTVLPKMGISCTVIDPSDLGGLERALEAQQVSLFFSESPTNPYLRCVDIRAIAKR
jgi:cystathionine gamma-synthase